MFCLVGVAIFTLSWWTSVDCTLYTPKRTISAADQEHFSCAYAKVNRVVPAAQCKPICLVRFASLIGFCIPSHRPLRLHEQHLRMGPLVGLNIARKPESSSHRQYINDVITHQAFNRSFVMSLGTVIVCTISVAKLITTCSVSVDGSSSDCA